MLTKKRPEIRITVGREVDDAFPNATELKVRHTYGQAIGSCITMRGFPSMQFAADFESSACSAAGWLEASYFFRSMAYLYELKVERKFRGRGIGTVLVNQFVGCARKRSMDLVALYANPSDIRDYDRLGEFYVKCGFTRPFPTDAPSLFIQILNKRVLSRPSATLLQERG